MPLTERVNRHEALLERVRKHDIPWWAATFLEALTRVEQASERI
jgi:trehalose 6-phosphate synthase